MIFWTILTGISILWYIVTVIVVVKNAYIDVMSLLNNK